MAKPTGRGRETPNEREQFAKTESEKRRAEFCARVGLPVDAPLAQRIDAWRARWAECAGEMMTERERDGS